MLVYHRVLLLGVSVPVYTVDSPFGYPTYHSGQQTITICIQDGTGVAFGKDLHSCDSILKLNEEMSVCPSLRLAILGGEVGIQSTNLANGWLATMTSCRKSGAQEHRTTLSAVKFCSCWSRTQCYFWCLDRGYSRQVPGFSPPSYGHFIGKMRKFSTTGFGVWPIYRWFTVLENGDFPWQTVK
jgi:hypothetical protein